MLCDPLRPPKGKTKMHNFSTPFFRRSFDVNRERQKQKKTKIEK